MPEKEKYIKNTLKNLQDIRKPREDVWGDIIDLILPGLEQVLIWEQSQLGGRIGKKRYDGTGVSALQLFADGLFGYLISPSIAWLKFKVHDSLMEFKEVRQWLQDLEAHYYSLLSSSNFYDCMSTYFEHAPAMGYAVKSLEEDMGRGGIVFKNYHPGECYLSEDMYGKVDTVFREFDLEARVAVEKFGIENVSHDLKEALNNNDRQRFRFIHAVYPRKDRDRSKIDNKNKKYVSVWMQPDGGIGHPDGMINKESGFDTIPYKVWRYKRGNTPYGIGPAEDALVEVMTSNQIFKDLLLAAEKAVKPSWNAPAEMADKVDVTPDGINYYADPNKKLEAVRLGIDFPIGKDVQESVKMAVENHFKVQFFTILSQMEGHARTATEIIELQGEKAAVLGRPINRLNVETLDPDINEIFDIENKAGRLPPMPPVLEDYFGENIDIEYMGPLAQAQKKLFQSQGFQQGLEFIRPIIDFRPDTADVVDWDGTAKHILMVSGFPQKHINDTDKVKKIREGRQRAIAAEEAKEDMVQMASVTEKMAKADKQTGGKISEQVEGAIPGG